MRTKENVMTKATIRIEPDKGAKNKTLKALLFLCRACVCAAILAGWSAGTARGQTAPERNRIARAADNAATHIRQETLQARRERFDNLVDRAKEYLKRKQYGHAFKAAEEALKIYPDDDAARYVRNKALDDSSESKENLLKSAGRSAADEAMSAIDKQRIVPSRVITGPDAETWADVIARSRKLSEGRGVRGPIVVDWEHKLKQELGQRISFSFTNAPLAEITKHLQDMTGVPIVIDPKAPIGKTPITLPADDVTLESALNLICRFADVKWSMADTMIYISDVEVTDQPEVATYDVVDLIMPVRDFRADDRPSPMGGTNLGLSERNRTGFESFVYYSPVREALEERDKEGHDLASFIMNTVARGTWVKKGEPGGGANTIQYRNGRLVVSHSADVQDQIVRLLESFRKARTVQITVQAKFIEIEKNYLEEIGVDWTGLEGGVNTISTSSQNTPVGGGGLPLPIARGFSVRGNAGLDEFGNPWSRGYRYEDGVEDYPGLPDGYDALYGDIPDEWRRNPEPTHYWQDRNGDGVVQPNEWLPAKRPGGRWDIGMADINRLGMTLGDGQTFNADGGLILDLAYLTRFQVRLLLEAVVKHRKGNVLTSPKLTCFNGQRANIAITSQVSYIRTIAEGVPEIGIITDGIVFEVVPYASADRRYITMEILPTLRLLERPIELIEIAVPEELDDGNVAITHTFIQLPRVSVKSIETFASVPDGGTLLLGGLSRANEGEGSAGVPILNDIPILKFFFSRWGKTDTRYSLIVLVKADILIQGEKEPKVGPAS